jgi:hypothetical protein
MPIKEAIAEAMEPASEAIDVVLLIGMTVAVLGMIIVLVVGVCTERVRRGVVANVGIDSVVEVSDSVTGVKLKVEGF